MKVSRLCLGTMTFGADTFGADEDENRQVLDAYLDAGGNFLDTASIYGGGESERMLGRFLEGRRQGVVLASKYGLSTDHQDPNAGGSQRKNMTQSLERSLRRLQTDYLDLLWLHAWDGSTGEEEIMRGLEDLQQSGKVLHAGVSNAPAWWIAGAHTWSRSHAGRGFCALQVEYSLVQRTAEAEFLGLARHQDMAVTAWSPLAGGLLSGKFDQAGDSRPKGTRLGDTYWGDLMLTTENLNISQIVSGIAKELDASPAQVALAWFMDRRRTHPVIPIVGARTCAQLKDNLGATGLDLPDEAWNKLQEVSQPAETYPHRLLSRAAFRQMMLGDYSQSVPVDEAR